MRTHPDGGCQAAGLADLIGSKQERRPTVAFGKKEKRASRRMARHGVAAMADINGEMVEFVVNDMTALGLRLIFPRRLRLPSIINITTTPHAKARSAHVRWQRGTHAGIEFIR